MGRYRARRGRPVRTRARTVRTRRLRLPTSPPSGPESPPHASKRGSAAGTSPPGPPCPSRRVGRGCGWTDSAALPGTRNGRPPHHDGGRLGSQGSVWERQWSEWPARVGGRVPLRCGDVRGALDGVGVRPAAAISSALNVRAGTAPPEGWTRGKATPGPSNTCTATATSPSEPSRAEQSYDSPATTSSQPSSWATAPPEDALPPTCPLHDGRTGPSSAARPANERPRSKPPHASSELRPDDGQPSPPTRRWTLQRVNPETVLLNPDAGTGCRRPHRRG